LAQIVDALPAPAIVAFLSPRRKVHVNAAFSRLQGGDGHAGSPPIVRFGERGRLLPPGDDPIGRALAGLEVATAQAQLQLRSGEFRTVVVSGTPCRNDDGTVGAAIVVMHDLQHDIDAAGVLRDLTAHTPALLFTADPAGRIDSINARWNEFIGEAADELLGTGWTRFIHPDDVAHVVDDWSKNVQRGEPYKGQWRFLRSDGTYRWTEIRAEAWRDGDGAIRRWFGSGTDVDAQRRALESLDFLAETGATVAGAQEDVALLLDRLAHAALEGLADISIFDLKEEDGSVRRQIVGSPRSRQSAIDIAKAFEAPRSGERHPIARALHDGETLHVPYVDEAFIQAHIAPPTRQAAWRFIDIRSIVCAPMLTSGRSIGALTLVRAGTSVPFDTSDMRVIQEVARRAAVAIENVRFKERERREARNLRGFADMGAALGGSLGLRDTLDAAMRAIVPERASWAYVNLFDERGDLRVASVYHDDAEKNRILASHVGAYYARGDSTLGSPAVARSRTPFLFDPIDYDAARSFVSHEILETFLTMNLGSAIVVPLLGATAVRGTLNLCMDAGRSFAAADVDFFQELAQRMAPAIANAELFERERLVARSFQDAALPAALPRVPGFAFHAIYEAGKAEALVGGDWYDAFSLADGRIVVSIGDVAGSGLSAAVTMSGVRQAIRGAAHVDPDPRVMLEAANQAVREDAGQRFVTAFVGVIDRHPLPVIRYQSAGHPAPILWTADGTLTQLSGHGPPLGLRAERTQENRECAIPPGSLLALFTDGLIESTRNVLDGEAKVCAALLDPSVNGAEDPAKRLHDAVLVDGSRDDVAILTIRTTGGTTP